MNSQLFRVATVLLWTTLLLASVLPGSASGETGEGGASCVGLGSCAGGISGAGTNDRLNKKQANNRLASRAKPADSPFLNFDTDAEIDRLNSEMESALKQGKSEQALKLAQEVTSLALSEYGKEHTEYAKALNNLAWHEQNQGDYASARLHFELALSVYENTLGKDNPRLVPVINNLAILLAAQGDPSRAEPLLERALSLEEKVVGAESADLSSTLNNLAVIQDAAGRHSKSFQTLLRAYRIQESGANKADPVEKALTLSNLSMIYKSEGDLARSADLMAQALALREKRLQAGDPDLAETLNNLAMIEFSQKKKEAARLHLQKALSVAESGLPSDHIELSSILNNMVLLELSESNIQQARQLCLRSASIVDKHIVNVMPGLSFAEQRSFLNTRLPSQMSLLISTSRSETDAQVSYNYIFRWKGLLIDTLKRQSSMSLLSKDPVHGADVQKLRALRSQLTALSYTGGKLTFEEWKHTSDELLSAKESLERKLSAGLLAGSIKDVLSGMSLFQFASLLKSDELLVDICCYRRMDQDRLPGYVAFVLDNTGHTRLFDLGEAEVINRDVKSWLLHTVHRESNDSDFAALKNKCAGLLALKTDKIILCPDGELNRLPLSIFFDGFFLSQLDAPRELAYLRMLPPEEAKENLFLGVGGVDFGKISDQSGFASLPATLMEVEKLSGLAQANGMSTLILSGRQATKKQLLENLPRARVVHLATHGVFYKQGLAEKSYVLKGHASGLKGENSLDARDPLARSGLVFAASEGGDDDQQQSQILSAEELVGTDLRHCRSMVLSACETGLGDKENGQGVLGLRASIMAAGARMLLISLWKVPDYPTALFMDEFYKNIWHKKETPAAAMKHAGQTVAKMDFLKQTAVWGAWVLVGEGW